MIWDDDWDRFIEVVSLPMRDGNRCDTQHRQTYTLVVSLPMRDGNYIT